MYKVRKGGGEEIPLVQGKEQWLRLGLLDVIKLERHQGADTLKP